MRVFPLSNLLNRLTREEEGDRKTEARSAAAALAMTSAEMPNECHSNDPGGRADLVSAGMHTQVHVTEETGDLVTFILPC